MQSLHHQSDETTNGNYPPQNASLEASVQTSLAETGGKETRPLSIRLPLTFDMRLRLRREAERRDRIGEISRGMERAYLPLVEALSSGDANARSGASGTVAHLTTTLRAIAEQKRRSEELDSMMEQLLQATREARERRRRQNFKIALGVLLLVGALFRLGPGFFYTYWWMLFPFSGLVAADRFAYKRREAARKLGAAGDPRAVGVLAVALQDSDSAVRDTAAQELYRLLPGVRASDAPFIGADQMNALLNIAYGSDEHLKLALLQALEQIGDARAIPAVREMLLNSSPGVREQAEACLPFLLERERRARESGMLLRPASPFEVASDQLLRPADAENATPPEQLLRSSAQ